MLCARSATRPSHTSLDGTLHEVAERARSVGAKALAVETDVRDARQVRFAVASAMRVFGQLDAVVNNASAIHIDYLPTATHYDLMMSVNARGTFHMSREAHVHLRRSDLGHALALSPPLRALSPHWLTACPAYATSKWAMTMLTLGYADTLRANTLWPKTLLATAATQRLENATGVPCFRQGLPPDGFADAVHRVLCADVRGLSCLDADIADTEGGDGIEDLFTTADPLPRAHALLRARQMHCR